MLVPTYVTDRLQRLYIQPATPVDSAWPSLRG